MKRNEMNEMIKTELEHIPEENKNQKLLRYCYNMVRRSHLFISDHTPKEETLSACIEMLKKGEPSFQPIYDKNFFKCI